MSRRIFITLSAVILVLSGCTPVEQSPVDEEGLSSSPSVSSSSSSIAPASFRTYTNTTLGFSMDLPETVYEYGARETEPLVALEDPSGKTVYITAQYYYADENSSSPSDRREKTLEYLRAQDWPPAWELSIENVEDEEELTALLRREYGSGCSTGEKNETAQQGVYDVSIDTHAESLDDLAFENCPVNYAVFIRYVPAQKKVFYLTLGQDVSFIADDMGSEVYDVRMLESFRVLGETTGIPYINTFTDPAAGVRFTVPEDVTMRMRYGWQEDSGLVLRYSATKTERLDEPLGYGFENAEANMEALERGDYGPDVDSPVAQSKKVIPLGNGTSGKTFAVFRRIEVCDVTFERILVFYRNGMQIVLTLSLEDDVSDRIPSYFTTDALNCRNMETGADMPVWKEGGPDQFWLDITTGASHPLMERWYEAFDEIVESIGLL